ncbi:MAG: hypothetical protein ACP5UM_07270 [Anaerolineae bacterium]
MEEVPPRFLRLHLPPGPAGHYRLAQVDDYHHLPRARFPWTPPLRLSLEARVSHSEVPGTWGFGLWNDPFFAVGLGFGGTARLLPALPNAAWFFHASPPNHLTLRDDLPAQGFLAAAFSSPRLPSLLLALGMPFLPLLLWRPAARALQRLARGVVQEDGVSLDLDPTQWHAYALEWRAGGVRFVVDGQTVLETGISPRGPLGLVLWVDNQYAAFRPEGRLAFGTLSCGEPAALEVTSLSVAALEA